MELGAVKIFLSRQINEVGLVVGYIIIELHGKAPHGGSNLYLILF